MCSFPGCTNPIKCRGVCDNHYQSERRAGRMPVTHPKDGRSKTARYKRNAVLKTRYGITLEEYEALLADQGGVCKICRAEESQTGKAFSVDHDHSCCPGRRSCGKCVRGLLCYSCNTHLGWYDRNAESIRRYLEES